jgi:hypothetical protein
VQPPGSRRTSSVAIKLSRRASPSFPELANTRFSSSSPPHRAPAIAAPVRAQSRRRRANSGHDSPSRTPHGLPRGGLPLFPFFASFPQPYFTSAPACTPAARRSLSTAMLRRPPHRPMLPAASPSFALRLGQVTRPKPQPLAAGERRPPPRPHLPCSSLTAMWGQPLSASSPRRPRAPSPLAR